MSDKSRQGIIGAVEPGSQQGAVLVFCLIFLVLLTLMGAGGMDSAVLEERMAGNMQERDTAFQAAETALRAGEAWLEAQRSRPDARGDGSGAVWLLNAMDPDTDNGLPWWWEPVRNDTGWWRANGVAVPGQPALAEPPRYVIEQYPPDMRGESLAVGDGTRQGLRVHHRITARGTGHVGTTVVHLQSGHVNRYE